MTSVFFALLLVIFAIVFQSPKIVREQLGGAAHGIQALLILFAVLSLASTSFVTIGSDEVGLLSRIYLAQQLPPGHIIAMSNEKGPQAEILSPGFHFHFLLNVLDVVTKDHVVVIPAGKYGKLVAADGEPLRPGQTFADQIGPIDKMLDATYFLTHHGQKGPQTAVITLGSYRINTYLWKVTIGEAPMYRKDLLRS